MKKIFKRSIAILLCVAMIFNYTFSVLADENVESSEAETTYTETVETTESPEGTETTESIEEIESKGEGNEEVSDEFSEEIEEPEEVEDEPEEDFTEDTLEEVGISSPSEIEDELIDENEDIENIMEELEAEPEEEPEEELTLLDFVASPSDIEDEEMEELDTEFEDEIEEEEMEATPSEIDELPMMATMPINMLGDPVSNECKIGTTEYATLGDALTAVTTGQTITLIDDVSYENVGPNLVIDGKNVNIDFDGHTISVINVNDMMTVLMDPNAKMLFTVKNSGNLTVDDGEIVLSGMYASMITSFTILGTNSTLTLKDMQQTENADRLLTNNGGDVYIDGGTFGYGSSTFVKLVITNGGSLNIKNGASFRFQTALIYMGGESDSSVASPDVDMGTVVIDSGTFEQAGGDTNVIKLFGKSNVTLNGGTWTGSNAYSSILCIENKGYKSSVTINNFTSDSPYVFISASNPNIESFTANVNNGHYKYTTGQFAIDRNNGLKPNIRLKGGYYGPDVPDTDAFNELNDLCISGSEIQTLTSSDAEYANGYRYKISGSTPSGGGGSSGGGSGGGSSGGGSPIYDGIGNIVRPGNIVLPNNIQYGSSDAMILNNPIWEFDTSISRFRIVNGSNKVGFYNIANDIYYADAQNYLIVGWVKENNNWYYMDLDKTNFGKAAKGWKLIDNKWYYFDNDCRMLHDTTTPDGYVVNSNGERVSR